MTASLKRSRNHLLTLQYIGYSMTFLGILFFVQSWSKLIEKIDIIQHYQQFIRWERSDFWFSLPWNNEWQKKIMNWLHIKALTQKTVTGEYQLIENSQQDFYNKGTSLAIQAFFLGSGDHIPSLKQGIKKLEQAIQYFSYAQAFSTWSLTSIIANNHKISKELLMLLWIRTCLQELKQIIDQLTTINIKIQNLIELLKAAKNLVDFRQTSNPMTKQCLKELSSMLEQWYQQLLIQQSAFVMYQKRFGNEYTRKVANPQICLSTPILSWSDMFDATIDQLDTMIKDHTYLVQLLKDQKNDEALTQLCNNRQQLSQQMNKDQQTIEESLEKLEQLEQQQTSTTQTGAQASEPVYQNVDINTIEQAINQINKQAQQETNHMERIKQQDNYRSLKNLNQLFQEFYGDTKDFKQRDQRYEQLWR